MYYMYTPALRAVLPCSHKKMSPFDFGSSQGLEMKKHQKVGEWLLGVEIELRQLQLWQAEAPSAEALASTQPFCIDTLNFPQWLQFIFLVKMQQLVDGNLPLPSNCAIAPMAQEYFKVLRCDSSALLNCLARLDTLLTDS